MLKCSLVFTQSALTGAVSEADAAAAAAAFTGPQSGDYSLITRIKVKMKLGLMQGKPEIDSPLLLTQSEVWGRLRRLCKLIISCCIWKMWRKYMVQFLHSLWATVVWFNPTRLADAAMVEVLHLTKCTQLMQQWIRIAPLLCTTGGSFFFFFFFKSNYVSWRKNDMAWKNEELIYGSQCVCSVLNYNNWKNLMQCKCMMGNL